MSISDHGAQFQQKDADGVFYPIYPITKVEYIEGNIVQSINGVSPDENGNVTYIPPTYELPIATKDTAGGIILGNTLAVDDTGVVNITSEGIADALGYTPISQEDVTNIIGAAGSNFKIVDSGDGDIDLVSLQGDKPIIEQRKEI